MGLSRRSALVDQKVAQLVALCDTLRLCQRDLEKKDLQGFIRSEFWSQAKDELQGVKFEILSSLGPRPATFGPPGLVSELLHQHPGGLLYAIPSAISAATHRNHCLLRSKAAWPCLHCIFFCTEPLSFKMFRSLFATSHSVRKNDDLRCFICFM